MNYNVCFFMDESEISWVGHSKTYFFKPRYKLNTLGNSIDELSHRAMYVGRPILDGRTYMVVVATLGKTVVSRYKVPNDAFVVKPINGKIEETIPVTEVETGITHLMTIDDILDLINKDSSDDWTDYDESDWLEGWVQFVEPEGNWILPKVVHSAFKS